MKILALAICLVGCVAFSMPHDDPSCFLLEVANNMPEGVRVYTTYKHRLVVTVDSAAVMRSWIDTDDISDDRTLALSLEAVKHAGYANIPPFPVVCEGETIRLNLGLAK